MHLYLWTLTLLLILRLRRHSIKTVRLQRHRPRRCDGRWERGAGNSHTLGDGRLRGNRGGARPSYLGRHCDLRVGPIGRRGYGAPAVSISGGSGVVLTPVLGPDAGMYPSTVGYFQQRKVYANTPKLTTAVLDEPPRPLQKLRHLDAGQ
jgi:hypothetical protein